MTTHDFLYLVKTPVLWKTPMALTIGVFDGLHKGHQQVLETVTRIAGEHQQEQWETMAIIFDRNPKMAMGSRQSYKPLLSRSQTEEFFAKLGFDYLVVIDFSDDFSKITGEEFISLVCGLCSVKAMVVGEDFRCGAPASAAGPVQLQDNLSRLAPGSTVTVCPFVQDVEGDVISSSMVRENLQKGMLSAVSNMLGRDYEVDLAPYSSKPSEDSLLYRTGQIMQLLPKDGMYEASVRDVDGSMLAVVASIDETYLQLDFPAGTDVTMVRPVRVFFHQGVTEC